MQEDSVAKAFSEFVNSRINERVEQVLNDIDNNFQSSIERAEKHLFEAVRDFNDNLERSYRKFSADDIMEFEVYFDTVSDAKRHLDELKNKRAHMYGAVAEVRV